ncbi:glycogen synthase, partial [Streptococcus gallolyticus]
FIPDVVHVHDYHTAMIPFLLKEKYHWINAYKDIKTVLTIHNLEFQGQYDSGMLGDLFGVGYERYADGTLRWNDCLNWLKAGILYSDRVTTVSPSYAQEIMTPAFGKGLDQILRMESGKLIGITNGIDTDLYNPETDPHIPEHFSVKDLSGKAKDKRALQERVGLPVRDDVPLIGIVSRLTDQKGFDLVVNELNNILHFDLQVVLLGTGYTEFENSFAWFGSAFPDKMSANITFDIELAQQIYAASDIFLMPSAFEPCGLSQMMAMRYGTLPLVHEVGGLRDTVSPYNQYEKTGTGFGFQDFSGYWLTRTVEKAVDLYYSNKEDWSMLQKNAMTTDFSWDTASKAYEDLYEQLD